MLLGETKLLKINPRISRRKKSVQSAKSVDAFSAAWVLTQIFAGV
jgi:hypothetical protein